MKRFFIPQIFFMALLFLFFSQVKENRAQVNFEFYTAGKQINALEESPGFLWAGTASGLVKINSATGERTVYLTTNSSLPSNHILSLDYAADGKLWIGTGYGGLAAFDSTSWQILNTSNSPLTKNMVNDVLVSTTGTVWAATDSGLCAFDGTNWQIFTAANSPLPSSTILSLSEQEGTYLWVGTNAGLVQYDGTNWTTFTSANSGLPGDFINALDYDINMNLLWIGTASGGAASFDLVNWTTYGTGSGLPSNSISALAVGLDGTVWIGTQSNGLAWFSGTAVVTYDTGNSDIPGNAITSLFSRSDGSVWVGTELKGLALFTGNVWTNQLTGNSGLPFDIILDVAVDANGKVWIATDGGGAAGFDGSLWEVFTPDNSPLPNEIVTAVTVATDGEVFFATLGGGIAGYDGTNWQLHSTSTSGIPDDFIADICVDSSGNIWVTTFSSGAGRYDGSTWRTFNTGNSGIATDQLGQITTAPNGDIWIGSFENGLMQYDGVQWLSYTTTNSSIPSNFISALGAAENGNIFAGSAAEGIGFYNGSSWQVYTTVNSALPGNVIYYVNEDIYQRIWACTNNGLASLTAGTWTPLPFNSGGSDEPIPLSIDFAPDGTGWVGTHMLLASFTPEPLNLDITVTAPNGGESWLVNSSHDIRWTSSNVNTVVLEYSYDNGVSWNLISNGVSAAAELYSWTIPQTPSNTCLVRVINSEDTIINDVSDNTFEIAENTQINVELTSPSEGETLTGGAQFEITWNTSLVTTFDIQLNTSNGTNSADGSPWIPIATGISSVNGSYLWTVPDRPTTEGKIRLVDSNDSTNTIVTNGFFVIVGSTPMVNQNFPNPFNPETEISFTLPEAQRISVSIYNTLGEEIEVLADNKMYNAGMHRLNFRAGDLPSGIYLYRVNGENFSVIKKMLLIK